MISVVMPVRDGERFLAGAMDSVLAQTYADLELIVVDDGSTDSTVDILGAYARDDDRVRVLRTTGAGISDALNVGLRHARSPWVARMDADDISFPARLAVQFGAALRAPHIVLWGSYAIGVTPEGRPVSVLRAGPTTTDEFRRLRTDGEPIQVLHPTALMRRDLALQVGGYDARFDGAEDLELWDRMLDHGEARVLPLALLAHRVHPNSASTCAFRHQRNVVRFVRTRCSSGDVLDFDELLAERKRRRLRWFLQALDDHARWAYRSAGVHYASGERSRAIARLAVATALRPDYALPRVWRQFVAPRLGGDLAIAIDGGDS